MIIRRVNSGDIRDINKLLYQLEDVHAELRPDIFKPNTKKYSDKELAELIEDYTRPAFAATEGEKILGYVFCKIKRQTDNPILKAVKTLYIENICVDESARKAGVGTALYEHVIDFAKAEKCYNVTLKVWSDNKSAVNFYESLGLTPRQITFEKII
ncbi:MAG: GNAT family N-acetyltransferase [Clostridia bacterium]|nr:GNAT family N-acetyltransferase [Clostridia bacterium]